MSRRLGKLEAYLVTFVTVTVCNLHTFTFFPFLVAVLYDRNPGTVTYSLGSSRGHSDTGPHSLKGLAIFFTVFFFKRLSILNAYAESNTFSQWVTPRNVGKVKEERNLE